MKRTALGRLAMGLALGAPLAAATVASAQTASDAVFTMGNYPVEARAADAVAAKERAIAEGQQAAFRSLLKRLTPVTAYKALAQLKSTPAANLVEGISVRSERNSQTSYTATLDFSFEPRRIRDLLRQRGIPFVDEQAPETAIVLVFQPAAGGDGSSAMSARSWRDAWEGLDLKHALTPVRLHDRPPGLTPDVVKVAMADANAPLRAIATLSRTGQAMVAVAEPDPAARRLHVTLSGTDAVGSFVLRRSWRMDPSDLAYAAEYAAVVAMGTLEGRWKAMRGRGPAPMPAPGAALQPVQLYVEFRSLQDWQRMRRQIGDLPGVSDFMEGGMSARSAEAALRYPGGGEALASALASQGIEARRGGGGVWVLRPAN